LPDIQSASVEAIPLLNNWFSWTSIRTSASGGRSDNKLSYNTIGPDYFATAGTSVLQGRDVRTTDTRSAQKVCWMNRSAAKYLFPGEDAIGKPLFDDESAKPHCVVAGIVQDTKYTNLRSDAPRMIYQPFMQVDEQPELFLMIRTSNIESAVASARRVLRDVAPAAPQLDPVTVHDQLHRSIGREETTAMLSIFFGALAVLLAGIGLYGLLSYQVVQRTREIGVRIALGASRANVVALIARHIALLMGIGTALGLAASLGVSRLIGGLLFDMRRFDLWTYIAAVALLGVASVIATYLPTRRATRVDPMIALRSE
jgi:predicted permease